MHKPTFIEFRFLGQCLVENHLLYPSSFSSISLYLEVKE